jgi:primosomal protein N' (replication factor Y)
MRVKVPFGRATVVGVLLGLSETSEIEPRRLKPALSVLDEETLLPDDTLTLLRWASAYYHHPLGDVIASALPGPLRQGSPARVPEIFTWRLTPIGQNQVPASLARAPRQATLLSLLQASPAGLDPAQVRAGRWRPVLQSLIAKGWVEERKVVGLAPGRGAKEPAHALNPAQSNAVETVRATRGFQAFLLDGVTGSGKTEIYLHLMAETIAAGRQVMLLVPEIGLTPQLIRSLEQRLAVSVAVLHSKLGDQARLRAWLMARNGQCGVLLGTRSAVFTPLRAPGLFIIDEEHDLSFKQQDGFRYHARDVAVLRAQRAGVPIILGSATPSLESLYNVSQQRYRHLVLPQRAGSAQPPTLTLLDMRRQTLEAGLSPELLQQMAQHLERDEQVLLFLNRRGFAPTLLCHGCGWFAVCARCDARMVVYRRSSQLRCHHCGAEQPIPQRCEVCACTELVAWGQGTERVEQALAKYFPEIAVVRIDADSTRRKGEMQDLLEHVQTGQRQILVGTQMLTKGHHFPNVTLVGVLDADQGLFGVDFRGTERMAQLIVQVAGRAGRSDKPGQVIIQTHHPDHPLLRTLVTQGYADFARTALMERCQAELPPYSSVALLRAEATQRDLPQNFLAQACQKAMLVGCKGLQLLGPVPAPMERRAGRYRAQLLIQAGQRSVVQSFLELWVPQLGTLPLARKVRWSIDVDAMEMF